MPTTAFNHFREDVDRARAIIRTAVALPHITPAESLLRGDLFRSAWMFAVGAVDAYFCDAYSDIVAATLIAKSLHPSAELPAFFQEIRLPVRAILRPYPARPNWRWRMASRELMENASVLSTSAIRTLFNKFLPTGRKLFQEVLPEWMSRADSNGFLFLIGPVEFSALGGAPRNQAVSAASASMIERLDSIFQRRHDCIHNCDRPRSRPQPVPSAAGINRVVDDVVYFVSLCDEHFDAEFRAFLLGVGFPASVVGNVGY